MLLFSSFTFQSTHANIANLWRREISFWCNIRSRSLKIIECSDRQIAQQSNSKDSPQKNKCKPWFQDDMYCNEKKNENFSLVGITVRVC